MLIKERTGTVALVLGAILAFVVSKPMAATAEVICETLPDNTVVCRVVDQTPTDAGGSSAGGGGSNTGGGSYSAGGNGSSGGGGEAADPCASSPTYLTLLDPQPPAGDPVWGGRSPAEGAIYIEQFCKVGVGVAGAPHFVANGSAGGGGAPPPPPPPDPAVLAEQLIAQMVFTPPSPQSQVAPGGTPVINQPIWFWVVGDATVTGPQSSSMSERGVTVLLSVELVSTTWSLGDGTSMTCSGPGAVYPDPSLTDEATAKSDSPSCGHRYPHSSKNVTGSVYTVSVTSTWSLQWHGGGKSGTVTREVSGGQTSFPIIEVAALNN